MHCGADNMVARKTTQGEKLDDMIVSITRLEERVKNLNMNFEEYKKSCVEHTHEIERIIGLHNGDSRKPNSILGRLNYLETWINYVKWSGVMVGFAYTVLKILEMKGVL